MIEWGKVVLTGQGCTLEFVFTALPPGATILVPEHSRSDAWPGALRSISGEAEMSQQTRPLPDGVQVEEVDEITLEITNQSGEDLQNLQVFYKNYESSQRLYLGGITFAVSLPVLPAGEQIRISPYRYVQGYSRVVSITWDSGT